MILNLNSVYVHSIKCAKLGRLSKKQRIACNCRNFVLKGALMSILQRMELLGRPVLTTFNKTIK